MGRISNLWVLAGLVLLAISFCDFNVSADVIPSENECRPYIEKAIHELKNVETTGTHDTDSNESNAGDSDGSIEPEAAPETGTEDDGNESKEDLGDQNDSNESAPEVAVAKDNNSKEDGSDDTKSAEDNSGEQKDHEDNDDSNEVPSDKADTDAESGESNSEKLESTENDTAKNQTEDTDDDGSENESATADDNDDSKQQSGESVEAVAEAESDQANDGSNEKSDEQEGENAESLESATGENTQEDENSNENDGDSKETDSKEAADGDSNENDTTENNDEESTEEKVRSKRSIPDETAEAESDESNSLEATTEDVDGDSQEKTETSENSEEDNNTAEAANTTATNESGSQEADTASDEAKDEETDEDDLTIEFEIPKNLRPRGHVSDLLGLDAESSIKENALRKTGDVILKELKKVFDNAVKPLELMYKYRDLSNRHFGDPEIFSKPLILFMGPWSGGKSTILNYLTGNEYTPNSIRSGAEPSPAYFNILMHGDEPEVLDGTQLAADWTFSGLQKFGQGLMDRLRGQKLPSKLLERVNIVEIPGILEVRKQVSRYFPFNDACQWFIDRADIIFLVYDPSKLDVGPETEAILDQLKGREYQTRILLNKADQVKPEELLRVQGALIWNISPLMSSAQPPIMYTVSLWSHPFASGAPIRLLQAQERAFLVDLREAIDRRIENKIASARRFAVRIRNHAKMVDCYLTTYYNQKGLFSNKKQVADKIIEHPQNFNIYEGLSTLTNISRYDLPDPEVYLDFFRLNPLYEFKKLSETCTYFKGCPINKLDIAIAYELPELVGKYKKIQEMNMVQLRKEYDDNCNVTEPELPVKIINSR